MKIPKYGNFHMQDLWRLFFAVESSGERDNNFFIVALEGVVDQFFIGRRSNRADNRYDNQASEHSECARVNWRL